MTWQRVVGGIVAVVLAVATASCSADPPPDAAPVIQPGKPGEPNKTLSPEEARTAAPATQPNDADVMYVQMMITHHRQAVEMSALAPAQGTDESVQGLAARIGATQGPEVDMMNSWLRQHGKPTVEAGHEDHMGHAMAMPGMATPEQLTALRAARGADFDRLFLQLMITHHEGALTMAHEVQTTGVDVRVQEMADDVIAEQTDEITRMHGMLGS